MKWLKWTGALALVILLAAIGRLAVWQHQQTRHREEAARISLWFSQAQAKPPAGVKAGTWEYICSAGLQNSVGNCLTLRRHVPTAELKKLADYLDATQGRDLQSIAGAYGMMEYIEALGPHCAGYFDGVRGQLDMEEGLRPTPTPIRIP
jgi:hypothetical protein